MHSLSGCLKGGGLGDSDRPRGGALAPVGDGLAPVWESTAATIMSFNCFVKNPSSTLSSMGGAGVLRTAATFLRTSTLCGRLALSNLAHANGPLLAKCDDILVCRDLVILQHDLILRELWDNFKDTMVELGWILKQVLSVLAQGGLPIVKVLAEVFEIIALWLMIENLSLGVLDQLRHTLVLQV